MQTAPANLSTELLAKYDVPVPRYTSYPTALKFTEDFDGDAIRESMRQTDCSGSTSLYFHLPFCEQLCWYCACTKVISRDHTQADRYVETLEREMALKKPLIGDRAVSQMHFGGGTPTFFEPDQLAELLETIDGFFDFEPGAERSIEIDPRACSESKVRVLGDFGLNRASLGVQDHNATVQEAINRHQPFEKTARAVEWCRQAGLESINFDLVYGLPHQTVESFRQTLDDLMSLEPDRIAIYSYAHVPWVAPAQKLLERAGLPDAETKIDLLKTSIDYLTAEGYRHIGLDHFARPDDDLSKALDNNDLRRNFQGYTTRRKLDIHAFGMSGISQAGDFYVQNAKQLDAYRESVENERLPWVKGYVLNRDDRIRRRAIERLMCWNRVEYAALSEQLGIDFEAYFAREIEALAPLEKDGLVAVSDTGIEITELGRYFVRNIASRFDAYLDREQKRYSKSV